jgi:hypothetical protein
LPRAGRRVSRARRFRQRGRRGLRWRYRGYSPGEVPAKAWPCYAGPKAAARTGRRFRRQQSNEAEGHGTRRRSSLRERVPEGSTLRPIRLRTRVMASGGGASGERPRRPSSRGAALEQRRAGDPQMRALARRKDTSRATPRVGGSTPGLPLPRSAVARVVWPWALSRRCKKRAAACWTATPSGPTAQVAASGRRTTAGNITNGVPPATSTTTGGWRCRRRGLILFIVYDDDGIHRRQCNLDWGDSDERERNMERIPPGIVFLPLACRISFDVPPSSSQNRSVFFSESLR